MAQEGTVNKVSADVPLGDLRTAMRKTASDIYSELCSSMKSSERYKTIVAQNPALSTVIGAFENIDLISSFLDLDMQRAIENRQDPSNMFYNHPPEIALIKVISNALSSKSAEMLSALNRTMNPGGNPALKEKFTETEAALDTISFDIDLMLYKDDKDFASNSMLSILSAAAWMSSYVDTARSIKMKFSLDIASAAAASISSYNLFSLTESEARKLFDFVNSKLFAGALNSLDALESTTGASFTATINSSLSQEELLAGANFETLAVFSIVAMIQYAMPNAYAVTESIVNDMTSTNNINEAIVSKVIGLAKDLYLDASKGRREIKSDKSWDNAYM
ncbi:MAG: hypothetical protein ACP5K9_00615 [Candidatus Micrarchaeia archaeon]